MAPTPRNYSSRRAPAPLSAARPSQPQPRSAPAALSAPQPPQPLRLRSHCSQHFQYPQAPQPLPIPLSAPQAPQRLPAPQLSPRSAARAHLRRCSIAPRPLPAAAKMALRQLRAETPSALGAGPPLRRLPLAVLPAGGGAALPLLRPLALGCGGSPRWTLAQGGEAKVQPKMAPGKVQQQTEASKCLPGTLSTALAGTEGSDATAPSTAKPPHSCHRPQALPSSGSPRPQHPRLTPPPKPAHGPPQAPPPARPSAQRCPAAPQPPGPCRHQASKPPGLAADTKPPRQPLPQASPTLTATSPAHTSPHGAAPTSALPPAQQAAEGPGGDVFDTSNMLKEQRPQGACSCPEQRQRAAERHQEPPTRPPLTGPTRAHTAAHSPPTAPHTPTLHTSAGPTRTPPAQLPHRPQRHTPTQLPTACPRPHAAPHTHTPHTRTQPLTAPALPTPTLTPLTHTTATHSLPHTHPLLPHKPAPTQRTHTHPTHPNPTHLAPEPHTPLPDPAHDPRPPGAPLPLSPTAALSPPDTRGGRRAEAEAELRAQDGAERRPRQAPAGLGSSEPAAEAPERTPRAGAERGTERKSRPQPGSRSQSAPQKEQGPAPPWLLPAGSSSGRAHCAQLCPHLCAAAAQPEAVSALLRCSAPLVLPSLSSDSSSVPVGSSREAKPRAQPLRRQILPLTGGPRRLSCFTSVVNHQRSPCGGAPCLEALQYQDDARSGGSKLRIQLPRPKIRLI
ncbi:basic proline-rich protein-like [Pogoniulus pusillus]|uniref:basic proline-rich protein-like n=1 Tax=Pogoniulus pusillus TaxID=488313 RepID=UPI0030B96167